MPATTPKGIRYPLSSEPPGGHSNMQALATDVDGLITAISPGNSNIPKASAAGTATLPSSGTFSTSVAVTFPVGRFTAGPTFIGTTGASSSTTYTTTGVGGVSSAGFTAYGATNSGSGTFGVNLAIYWFAVQF